MPISMQSITSTFSKCTQCIYKTDTHDSRTCYVFYCPSTFTGLSSTFFEKFFCHNKTLKCTYCNGKIHQIIYFHRPLPLLMLAINHAKIEICKSMILNVSDNPANYILKGVVYLGEFHFTSRIITSDNVVWFHDGITTANVCVKEDMLKTFNKSNLTFCNEKQAELLLYTKEPL